jgi:hypothetical protein
MPWLNIEMGLLEDIEDVVLEEIPRKPGVYLMMSHDTDYIYPWSKARGTSRVYYIGQGHNLQQRISTHKKFYQEIKEGKPQYLYYYPRYEYAAYHGCTLCWRTIETAQAAREVEKEMLIAFANYYGAKPVANSQAAWE